MRQLLSASHVNLIAKSFPATSQFGLLFTTCGHGLLGHTAADEEQDTPSLPDQLRCGYTSKRCENPRTVKKSGGLHSFCAYHRERANKNQWRVDNRRRIQKKQRRSDVSPTKTAEPSPSDCDGDSPRPTASTSCCLESQRLEDCEVSEYALLFFHGGKLRVESEVVDAAGSPDSLSDQDAEILEAMLFNDDEANGQCTSRGPDIDSVDTVATAQASASAPLCFCSSCVQSPAEVLYYQRYGGNACAAARWQTYVRI